MDSRSCTYVDRKASIRLLYKGFLTLFTQNEVIVVKVLFVNLDCSSIRCYPFISELRLRNVFLKSIDSTIQFSNELNEPMSAFLTNPTYRKSSKRVYAIL